MPTEREKNAINDENKKPEHPAGIVLGGTVLRVNGEIVSNGGKFLVNGKGAEIPEKHQDEKE